MPSSRDLSSPTDVYSPDDASDKGTVLYSNILLCFNFDFLYVGNWHFLCALLCRFVSNAVFSS